MQYITPATRLPPFLPYPRFLLELPLSETARLVYCLILARILTSQKNGWVDEKGRVYCRYPVLSLAEHCHKSKTTVTVALKDLESQGLLLRRRGGAGYANMLSLRLPENSPSEEQKTVPQRSGKPSPSYTNKNTTSNTTNIDFSYLSKFSDYHYRGDSL